MDPWMDGRRGGWPGERQGAGSEAGTAACLEGREGGKDGGLGGRRKRGRGAGAGAQPGRGGPRTCAGRAHHQLRLPRCRRCRPARSGARREPGGAGRGWARSPGGSRPAGGRAGGPCGRDGGRGAHRARGNWGGGLHTSRARGGGAPLYAQGVRETRGSGRWCPAGLCRLRGARCKWGNRKGTETGVMRVSRATGGFLLNPPAGVITRAGGFSCSLGRGPRTASPSGCPCSPCPARRSRCHPAGGDGPAVVTHFGTLCLLSAAWSPEAAARGQVWGCPRPRGPPCRGGVPRKSRGLSGPRPQFWQG